MQRILDRQGPEEGIGRSPAQGSSPRVAHRRCELQNGNYVDGGMETCDVKRLRALKKENCLLKHMQSDVVPGHNLLKEVIRNFWSAPFFARHV